VTIGVRHPALEKFDLRSNAHDDESAGAIVGTRSWRFHSSFTKRQLNFVQQFALGDGLY
jgi:hypothetical protein